MSLIPVRHSGKFGRSKRDGAKPLFLSQPFVSASLVSGSFRKIAAMPKYVDQNEWLAANTDLSRKRLQIPLGILALDFFNFTNLFYGTISEFCTQSSCPVMHAGSSCEYYWIDSQKRSIKVSAPQYIDYVMTWVQSMVSDEAIFPTKADTEFPRDFYQTAKHIFKQLFRVLAHIYYAHYDKILHLSSEAHLNTLFTHMVYFAKEFELLDKKDLAPMAEFISALEDIKRI